MPITLQCRFEHRFSTSAKPGGTTGCPVCRRETGTRTSVRVPVGAGRVDEGRQRQGAEDTTEARRLADAWAAEAPAVYGWRQMPTEPAEVECEECGEDAWWHSAHAALVCLECGTSLDSPALAERAEAHSAALARKRSGTSREIVIIDPEAEARARAARVDLRRHREMLHEYARTILTWCDANYQQQYYAKLAAELGATIRGYLPEITAADDNPTLLEILGELQAIHQGDKFGEIVAEHGRQREQAERARERAEYLDRQAELEAERAEAEAQRLADEREQARQLERERLAIQRRQPANQPRAINAARIPSQATYTAIAIADIGRMFENRAHNKAERERVRNNNGTCQWCNRTAYRLYGFNYSYHDAYSPQLPNYRACEKHYDTADKWLMGQVQAVTDASGSWGSWGAPPEAHYWELEKPEVRL